MGGASTTTNGDGTASGAAIDAPVGIDATASDAAASDAAASDAAARNGASASQNGSCSIFRCDATTTGVRICSDATASNAAATIAFNTCSTGHWISLGPCEARSRCLGGGCSKLFWCLQQR
jgi:hypothetical protein